MQENSVCDKVYGSIFEKLMEDDHEKWLELIDKTQNKIEAGKSGFYHYFGEAIFDEVSPCGEGEHREAFGDVSRLLMNGIRLIDDLIDEDLKNDERSFNYYVGNTLIDKGLGIFSDFVSEKSRILEIRAEIYKSFFEMKHSPPDLNGFVIEANRRAAPSFLYQSSYFYETLPDSQKMIINRINSCINVMMQYADDIKDLKKDFKSSRSHILLWSARISDGAVDLKKVFLVIIPEIYKYIKSELGYIFSLERLSERMRNFLNDLVNTIEAILLVVKNYLNKSGIIWNTI